MFVRSVYDILSGLFHPAAVCRLRGGKRGLPDDLRALFYMLIINRQHDIPVNNMVTILSFLTVRIS